MARAAIERLTRGSGSGESGFDYPLLLAVLGIISIGLIMVYSATFDWTNQVRLQVEEGGLSYIERQAISTAIGVAIASIVAFVPYEWWRRGAIPVMLVTVAVLVLVLLVGDVVNDARRTFFNGRFQASEVAKLGTVVYLAAWLSSKQERVRNITYGLIPFAVLIGVNAGLIVLQPDVSVAVLIVVTSVAMLFLAGADLLQLGAIAVIGTGAFYALVLSSPGTADRFKGFWQLWSDPTLVNEHLQQALIALGSGGLFGVGLGQGIQKLGYLPVPHTDAIFAVLGEEAGFAGCVLLLGLFALFAYRGFTIAKRSTDPFAALLAAGITCWIVFQAAINIGVITGLLPFTGSALPFVTYGGSSMVVNLVGVGLLLSISRSRRAKNPNRGRQPARADLDRGRGNRGTRVSGPGRGRSAAR